MIVLIESINYTMYLQPKFINLMTLDVDSSLILWNEEGRIVTQFDNDTLRNDAITLLATNGDMILINYAGGIMYINVARVQKIILISDSIITINCKDYGEFDIEFVDSTQLNTALNLIIASS